MVKPKSQHNDNHYLQWFNNCNFFTVLYTCFLSLKSILSQVLVWNVSLIFWALVMLRKTLSNSGSILWLASFTRRKIAAIGQEGLFTWWLIRRLAKQWLGESVVWFTWQAWGITSSLLFTAYFFFSCFLLKKTVESLSFLYFARLHGLRACAKN